eukprot:m.164703 g.164703  ORF g.164703 m.164703 type:complete len:59 (+) comp17719_c0_seq6:121-297(+)
MWCDVVWCGVPWCVLWCASNGDCWAGTGLTRSDTLLGTDILPVRHDPSWSDHHYRRMW